MKTLTIRSKNNARTCRSDLIEHLERYGDEIAMSSDAGYHLRQLIEALRQEEEEATAGE